MEKIFAFYLQRLSTEIQDRLKLALSNQHDPNPNERVQAATVAVLKELVEENERLRKALDPDSQLKPRGIFARLKARKRVKLARQQIRENLAANQAVCFEIASLSCYLTQKMKATEGFLNLLSTVDHPYIELYRAYFEDSPSNYRESMEKIALAAKRLEGRDDYTEEMHAHLVNIETWVHGQQGDVAKLKESYKYTHERLPQTNNLVEHFALQDCVLNAVWWLLHSGIESNIDEMLDFVESFILAHRLYKPYTSFLNVKGAVESYFGNNVEAMRCFEELQKVHEEYHDNYRLAIATGNLAETYFAVGQILKAKEMLEIAIKLYKDSTGQWPYLYLAEIGNIYYLLGDPRAEESFLHAYEIQRKEKSMFKAFIMQELIHFYLRSEKLSEASKYLSELRELAKELQAPSVNAFVDYLLGFYEMLDQNLSNAIKYLQSALQQAGQTKDMELILFCNIQLAAAYLQRYRLNEQQETLNIALNYIDTVIQLAIENQHNQILSLGLMTRAALRVITADYEKSQEDLDKAKEVGKEIDFEKWKEDLANIERSILDAKGKEKMEIESQKVIETILPQFKSMLSLKLMERKPKESEVLGVLIISESGVPVYSKLKGTLKTDQLLLSGLLMAISQLAYNIIEGKDKGRLQDVLYEHFSITMQPIKNGLVAVIATEVTAEIRLWSGFIAERVKEVPVVITRLSSQVEAKISDLLEQMNI